MRAIIYYFISITLVFIGLNLYDDFQAGSVSQVSTWIYWTITYVLVFSPSTNHWFIYLQKVIKPLGKPLKQTEYTQDEVETILEEYRLHVWKNGATQHDLDKFINTKFEDGKTGSNLL